MLNVNLETMSTSTRLWATVTSPEKKVFSFVVSVHNRNKKEMVLSDLYSGQNMEKGTRELKILNLHNIRFLNASMANAPIHIHVGADKNTYVCYPFQIPTEAEAENVFIIWSTITAFQMLSGQEPNNLVSFVMYENGDLTPVMALESLYGWLCSQGWSCKIERKWK